MSSSSQELATGTVLDSRYRIRRKIGAGGMGSVYSATRLALGDLVAVKLLHAAADTLENRSRLLAEARAAAHIRHPNVVEIFDFGKTAEGSPYLVMEHLDGQDMHRLLKTSGRFSTSRALELFAPVCAAVEAGHRRGVIHRDIKPSNVLIDLSDDGREVVKVLDFGLAVFREAGAPPSLDDEDSQEQELIGTPQFMAPETVRGEASTPATDVFALGVLLYQMLTGRLPYSGKTPLQILMAVAQGTHCPIASIAPDLPKALTDIVDRALDTDPGRRPESPEQMARLAERAVSRGSRPPSVETDRQGPDTFVAREKELKQLRQEYDRALGGEGRIVLVIGEPGIGKTRLVEHFVEQPTHRSPVVSWGRFFDNRGTKAPSYAAFRAMLPHTPETTSGGPGLASGPSRKADEPGFELDGEELDGEEKAWELHAAMAEAFAALAGSRPLVLVLDDLHRAGRADLELIDHLHQALSRRGTLILATLRRGEIDGELRRWMSALAGRRISVELPLPAFELGDVERYLERELGIQHVHPRDLRRLHRASSGNPYFLAETLRHLVAEGTISERSAWPKDSLRTVDLPPTITHLVEARLGELPQELRRMLDVAAVIGDTLRFEVLAAAAGIEEETLEDRLEQAVRQGWLRDDSVPAGYDLAFAGETARRVLYDTLSRSRRRRIHRQVIAALHGLPDDPASLAPELAYHSAAVEQWPETLKWSLLAAERALRRFDSEAAEFALELGRRAVAGGEAEPDAESLQRLSLAEGMSARRLGRPAEAQACLLRALDLSPDRSYDPEIRLEIARCRLALGELQGALSFAREVGLDPDASPDLALKARMCEAAVLLRLGQAEEAASRLDALLELAGKGAPLSLRSRLLRDRSWADLKRGAFAEAERRAQKSLEWAKAAGDLPAQHHALSALAAIRAEGGEVAGALPYNHQALELARRLSLRRREGIDLANIGESHYRLGEVEPALEHFQAALAIFVEIGDRACQGDCGVNVGRSLLARGETEAALHTLAQARALCEATGRKEYAALAHVYEGEALLKLGRVESARHSFEHAVGLFEDLGSHLVWMAELGLARSAHRAGNTASAVTLARQAAERLRAQRASIPSSTPTPHLDQAMASVDALLDELG